MPIGRRSSGGSSFSMSAQSAFEMSFLWCALTMTLRASSSSGIFCCCSAGSRSKIVTTFSNGFLPSGASARLASRAAFRGSTCSIRSTMIATPVWPCLPVTGSTRSSSFCATSIADPGVSVRRIRLSYSIGSTLRYWTVKPRQTIPTATPTTDTARGKRPTRNANGRP